MKQHLYKSNSYLALGTWFGWIITWLYIGWKTTLEYLEFNGTVTVAEFMWINFIPIIFLIWNFVIVYNSRELLFKMKQKDVGMFVTGAVIIIIVMVFILLPFFLIIADNIILPR